MTAPLNQFAYGMGGVDGSSIESFNRHPDRLRAATSINRKTQEEADAKRRAQDRANGEKMQEAIRKSREEAARLEAERRKGPAPAPYASWAAYDAARFTREQQARQEAARRERFYSDSSQWTPEALKARKEIPILGSDPRYTPEYADAWWTAHGNAVNGRPRAEIEREIRSFVPSQMSRVSHKDGRPYTQTTEEWLSKQPVVAPGAEGYDPIWQAKLKWLGRNDKTRQLNDALEDKARHAGVAQYYTANVLNAIPGGKLPFILASGLFGGDPDYVRWTTGVSEEEMPARYYNDYIKRYGEDAAKEARNWTLGMVTGGKAAGAVTAGLFGNAMGNTNLPAWTQNAAAMWFPWNTTGLTMQAIGQGTVAASDNPYAQHFGQGLNAAGKAVANAPYYALAFGGAGEAARALGNTPGGQAVVARYPRLVNYGGKVLQYPFGRSKFTGRFARFADNATRRVLMDQMWGAPSAIKEEFEAASREGRDPSLLNALSRPGYIASNALKVGGMSQDLLALGTGMGPLMVSDRPIKYWKEVDEGINQVLSNDRLAEQMSSYLGVPRAQLHRAMLDKIYEQREQTYQYNVLQSLDPKRDWSALSSEQLQQELGKFPKDKLGEAKYRALRADAIMGRSRLISQLADSDLTDEQAYDVLRTYMTANDKVSKGKGNVLGQLWDNRDVAHTLKFMQDLLKRDPSVESGVVAYGRRRLRQQLDGTYQAPEDPKKAEDEAKLANGMLGLLGKSGVDSMLGIVPDGKGGLALAPDSPLASASPDQMLSLTTGANASSGPGADINVRNGFTTALALRMRDGNFASDFLQGFGAAVKNGTSLPEDAREQCMDIISKTVDPKQTFSTMDLEHFKALGQYMYSQAGSDSLDGMGEKGVQIKKAWTDAAKDRALQFVKENPLTGIPMLASLWAYSKGWNGLGDFVGSPGGFWGMAALLLLGGLGVAKTLSGDTEAEDDENEASQGSRRRPAVGAFDEANRFGVAGM